jgi:hypothetical protein
MKTTTTTRTEEGTTITIVDSTTDRQRSHRTATRQIGGDKTVSASLTIAHVGAPGSGYTVTTERVMPDGSMRGRRLPMFTTEAEAQDAANNGWWPTLIAWVNSYELRSETTP